MNNQNGKRPNKKKYGRKEPEHNINERITHAEVRITGEGIEPRIVSRQEALRISREAGLDLVEIAPQAVPPVCKVIEYSKFLYELKQKEKDRKRNQQQAELKEMRLTPSTDDHDVEFKCRHARKWLGDGDRVKCVVVFKGRQMAHKEIGEMLLLKVYQKLEDCAKAESLPKMEGFKMFMMLVPKK